MPIIKHLSTNEMLAAAAFSDILYIICMVPNQLSRWPSMVLSDCPGKFFWIYHL